MQLRAARARAAGDLAPFSLHFYDNRPASAAAGAPVAAAMSESWGKSGQNGFPKKNCNNP
jgi:hypothetical protein